MSLKYVSTKYKNFFIYYPFTPENLSTVVIPNKNDPSQPTDFISSASIFNLPEYQIITR